MIDLSPETKRLLRFHARAMLCLYDLVNNPDPEGIPMLKAQELVKSVSNIYDAYLHLIEEPTK